MRNLTVIIIIAISCFAASARNLKVSDNIEVRKLSDKAYQYTAWAEIGSWGLVGSNGLILKDGNEAFLFDTPMHESQTKELVDWIKKELKADVTTFVPGHWHRDCVGGLDYLNKTGVETYANIMTNDILKEKGLPTVKHTFSDSINLKLKGMDINCYYLGGGHSTDNIVVWIPSEKILFGGCMLKDCMTNSLGNTEDAAPIQEWIDTVSAVEARFPDAETVIPGHGETGNTDIIKHTRKLLIENK